MFKPHLFRYNALEAMKLANQEATLELVKSGRSDKLTAHEAQLKELQESIESKNETLNILNTVSLHLLSGLGAYISLTKCNNGFFLFRFFLIQFCLGASEKQLVDFFHYLVLMLDNDHRYFNLVVKARFVHIV